MDNIIDTEGSINSQIDIVSPVSVNDSQPVAVDSNISGENGVISSLSAMVPIVSTLHTLTSINGREIKLRNNGTYIQWHYVDEQAWTNLVALADITGPQGETGATGQTGATGATGNGVASVTKISTSGLVDTYRMTFTNGNYTNFTVTNGADGSGGLTVTSLWTNSSPTSSFISQTINLSSSDWDYLLVTYLVSTGNCRTKSVIYDRAETSSYGFNMSYENTNSQYGVITAIRNANVTTHNGNPTTSYSQIYFENAYFGRPSNESLNNDYCIPYTIRGIKIS